MDILTFKKISKDSPDDQAILVKGYHGIGKSEVIRQIGEELGLECVTFMCSQVSDVGDIIGLPSIKHFKVDKATKVETEINEAEAAELDVDKFDHVTRTVFNPPFWYKKDTPVLLFFDEINRARNEISNALMQITLEQKILDLELPAGTRIFAAINPSGNGNYEVEDMDAAKIDRYAVYELRPSEVEWLNHADEIGVHESIINYIEGHKDDLDAFTNPNSVKVASKNGGKLPSRRSWTKLSNTIKKMESIDKNYFRGERGNALLIEVAAGYVGPTVAVNFADVYFTGSIDPNDVIFGGVEKYKDKIKAFRSTKAKRFMNNINKTIQGYLEMNKVAIKDKLLIMDVKSAKKIQESYRKLLEIIPKEIVMSLMNVAFVDAINEGALWARCLVAMKIIDKDTNRDVETEDGGWIRDLYTSSAVEIV